MSPVRHYVVAVVIVAGIVLSGGACTAEHPEAGSSASNPSAGDKAICTAVDEAYQNLLAQADAHRDDKAALADAMMDFATLVQDKKEAATAPRLRDALQFLGASAEWQAINRGDGSVAAISDAKTRLNRPCGEPASDRFAAGDWIGAPTSPCTFPISFQIGKKWRAVPVGDSAGRPMRKGSLAMVCEMAPRPAERIAFIRVWIDLGASLGPRPALDAYLQGEDVRKPVWSDPTLGGTPGAEVAYETNSESPGEARTERAFAVRTPRGVVLVALGGMDVDDKAAVAAYELAKKTLTVNT